MRANSINKTMRGIPPAGASRQHYAAPEIAVMDVFPNCI